MPDGNVPSARIPTPSDDQSRSSPTPDEARAPSSREPSNLSPAPSSSAKASRSSSATPQAGTTRRTAAAAKPAASAAPTPAPADRLTRLDTLRKQLIDARSSPLALTELLQKYDKELFAIKIETEKNGGLSPLSYKEQLELRRVEEEREALANTREDDPRARARAIAAHLKQLSAHKPSANVSAALEARREQAENSQTTTDTGPTAHDIKRLRSELNLLKNEAWQNNLTRELNRNQGATIDELEQALEQAERAVKIAKVPSESSLPISPPEAPTPNASDNNAPPEETLKQPEEPSLDEDTSGDEAPANDNALEEALIAEGGVATAAVADVAPSISETREVLREAEQAASGEADAESLPLTQDEEAEIAQLNYRFHHLSTALTNQRETLLRSADALQREAEELQSAELNDEQHAELRRLVNTIEAYSTALNRLADTAQKDNDAYNDQFSAFSETTPDERRTALRERRAIVAAFEKQVVDGFLPYSEEAATDTQQLLAQQRPILEQALERARAQNNEALVNALEEIAFKNLPARSDQANEHLRASIDTLRASATQMASTSVDDTTEASITDARAELRAKYAARLHEQDIFKLYQDRMRERSWAYLQTREPAQYQRLQSMQAQLRIEIDASTTLTQQELETVHLQAIQDVRLRFPEVTDALLSTILLQQAKAQLTSAAALQAGVSAAALQTAAESAAIAGAAIGTATIAASVTGAGLLTAFAKQRETADQVAQELAAEEQRVTQRATTVKTVGSGVGPGVSLASERSPGGEQLRQAQRESVGKRRGLQAKLNVGLRQLQAWNTALGEGAAGVGTSLTPETLGALAVISPTTFRIATTPVSSPPPRQTNEGADTLDFDETTRRMQQTRDRLSRQQEDAQQDTLSPEQREHAKAAHLQSLKARAKNQLPSITQPSSRTTESPSTSQTIEQAPLLALTPAPKTRQEAFARRQSLMNHERDQFLGVGSQGSSYDATFGLATAATADKTVEDLSEFVEEVPDETIDVEAQDLTDEQARQAELLRRQQLAAQEEAQAEQKTSTLNGQNLQRAQQAAKLLRGAGTLSIGAMLAVVLVVVAIVWLNIRLLFPNPESSWRKPMGSFGKLGTAALDALVLMFSVVNFLVIMGMLLLPIIMLLLPGAIIAATLMRAIGL